MNIVVEKQPKCTATLHVEISSSDVSQKRNVILANYASHAKIPGFRPGKAPKSVIEKRYGKQITEELNDALFEAACDQALENEDLKVLDFGFPSEINERPDGSIAFQSRLILAPDFTLPNYKGIAIKSPPTTVTDEEINQQLDNLRERLCNFEDITDRPLQDNDIAIVDFTSTIDGQPITEVLGENASYLAKRESHWLAIKEGSFLPGYSDQVKGLSVGDTKDVTITLPEDYPMEDLRGKNLTLHTSVTGIKAQKLPDLDDAFAATLLPGKSLDDLKELISTNLAIEKEKQITDYKVNQIIDHLNNSTSFELPDELLQRETQNQANAIVNEGTESGASEEEILRQRDEIFSLANQRATTNLRSNFLLQEIATAEKIEVSNEDIYFHIAKIAQARKQPVKKVIKDLQQKRQIQSIRNSLLIGKTIDFLLEQATVTEVSSEEITNPSES